jgi:hypothetical protein
MEHCESKHQNIWLGLQTQSNWIEARQLISSLKFKKKIHLLIVVGVVYGYKGLLLIFGLFLAYETRSMKGEPK